MNEEAKAITVVKATYWVRSKQTTGIGGTPAPDRFKTWALARRRQRELNLRKGPYHPGYFVEVQDDSPPPFVPSKHGFTTKPS